MHAINQFFLKEMFDYNPDTGVSFNKKTGKYQADICVNNNHIYLGVFNTAEDANQARLEASKKYGFHKNHGREL